jgi:hypothetical protein
MCWEKQCCETANLDCPPTRQQHLIFGVSQLPGSRAAQGRSSAPTSSAKNQKLRIAKLMVVMAARVARPRVSSVLGQSGCGRAD